MTVPMYAGIGSRETPESVLHIMRHIGFRFAQEGYGLRSGKALGADTAFETGAAAAGGLIETFTADSHIPDWAFETVEQFHPAPHRLSNYVRRLHARNAMILFGESGTAPVKFIVCWTPNAAITGGTGQALRIAQGCGISVRNLANSNVEASALEWIQSAA